MIKTSIEKLAKEIGFDIAHSDDVVQSDLLNGLFEELRRSIPDKHLRDMQLCYIASKLSDKSKEAILELVEFLK